MDADKKCATQFGIERLWRKSIKACSLGYNNNLKWLAAQKCLRAHVIMSIVRQAVTDLIFLISFVKSLFSDNRIFDPATLDTDLANQKMNHAAILASRQTNQGGPK